MEWPEIGAYGESSILYPNVVHFGAQKEHCLARLHDLKHNYAPGDEIVHGWMEHEEKRLKLLNILIGKYGEKPVEDECFKVDTFVSLDPDCLRFPKQKWLKPIRNPDTKEIFRYEDLCLRKIHLFSTK
jgi:hypothetical protein